jgi:ferredoxin
MAANLAAPAGRASEVEAEHQSQLAFYLTGRRHGPGLAAIEGPNLRPALLASYRDLTRLRYDYPLVLMRVPTADAYVQSLSGLVDGVVGAISGDDDSGRPAKHLLRLEQEIRTLLASGAAGSLTGLWDTAAGRLAAHGDDALKDCLKRARGALKTDGEVIDCDRELPSRLLRHAWSVVQEAKARTLRDEIRRLTLKLSEILTGDLVRSEAGRSPRSLQAALGPAHGEVFDFDSLSRVLATAAPKASMPPARRRRIQWLLSVLQMQRFFAVPTGASREQIHSFVFDDCAGALAAYRERLPQMVELAKAMEIARLEIEGEYNEAAHDPLFKYFGASGLAPEVAFRFPDYLIHVGAEKLASAENDTLMEMLSAGLPAKVLVQTDDLIEESPIAGDAHLAFGLRSRQLVNMAIGLNEVCVLQSSSSHLYQFRERIVKAMSYAGPALFSVYSGAGGKTGGLPPYLNAAAAMESRAFPAFTYDPSAGANWASRFDAQANSQVELDWPVQSFSYEDERHQRVDVGITFTPADFVACDARYAQHFALVPRAQWSTRMVPFAECLGPENNGGPEKIPSLLMVDRDDVLHKVIVHDKLVRAVRRCREAWHSLQELGGIHNSHAEKLLARERNTWEEQGRRESAALAQDARSATPVAAAVPTIPGAALAAAEPEEKRSPDEPYIESARCTTCNECTQINDSMFAYDENKQAHIVNPDAGTYRQLVEAAESCQVSIIHPGKPRNPGEPGLEELLKRAEPFL